LFGRAWRFVRASALIRASPSHFSTFSRSSFDSPIKARDDFTQLILDSSEIKLTHSYKRAKEIYGEDPAWLVRGRNPGNERGLRGGGWQRAGFEGGRMGDMERPSLR
jgi:hypothetical protein